MRNLSDWSIIEVTQNCCALFFCEKDLGGGECEVKVKLSYVARVLSGVRPGALMGSISTARSNCGWSGPRLFFDMLWCAARYGAGYHDYVMFHFYELTGKQRDTYVTRLKNKRLVTLVNDPKAAELFDRKTLFYPLFKEYLGRDYLIVSETDREELARFLKGRETVFAKPDVGESGKGIERIRVSDFATAEGMLMYLEKKGLSLVEEELTQHPDMGRLYPGSANTMRVVTLLTGGPGHWQANCVYAVVKMGTGGKAVDNLENGGLFCPIDRSTGRICGVGHKSDLTTRTHHPDTGVELIGYKIPYVEEAIELCKKAALVEPRMRYLGWDVCITPDGPVIVEGNDYPGYDFWQQPEHTPDRIGLWPTYQKLIPELRT